jgi:glyoxylase-like metal-dependent hydrolase (beta-lactamase superfamily II)
MGAAFHADEADRLLEEGDEITLGTAAFQVLHTPGHTPGGICFYRPAAGDDPGIVFTGDTLFASGIGRTDFPGGSSSQLLTSISSKLLTLPDDTIVYAGHGPHSTIGREKQTNPWL